ncbi:hypothetical protein KC19_10G090700 [Ceratodon purpureus]|uniref:Uncharacterized protein n=1 Tax=Ceratodon purpureus TaxID=3225 RepID=A0A8T0GJR5_CERPU|nr:hypothetical protein KC19_10G090700 [Ceratodon purpureus]
MKQIIGRVIVAKYLLSYLTAKMVPIPSAVLILTCVAVSDATVGSSLKLEVQGERSRVGGRIYRVALSVAQNETIIWGYVLLNWHSILVLSYEEFVSGPIVRMCIWLLRKGLILLKNLLYATESSIVKTDFRSWLRNHSDMVVP